MIRYRLLYILIFSLFTSGCLEASREAPPLIAEKYGDSVVLYSTRWCENCRKTKEFFSRNGIKYIEYDIESSDDGLQEFVALGGKGVPLVFVNGRVVEGYAPNAILKVIRDT